MNNNLRTDLAKAKGVGSAESGSSHWLHQRITAIILAICSIWLIFFIKCNIGKDLTHFVSILQKPYNIIPLGILVITTFYHSMLGMQVIIEDYISCIKLRIGLIIFLQIFCIITIGCLVVALFYGII
ncbi:MAG: succinate dehydrogenase, hydrophobic membrane anchor protein [Rickettsia endosymbiont of Pseudomimeciton antennatum]|nr:succinate dehydrogenase, hydrophobic membrane anchor protein [Rickettsia endosymbiont of Pseudomimeciton antennatum]MCC8398835.1 succinate dehydrogenase, hydrophobic membrane anchor protein [Rickettsia endosymbiont of Labidopullus appendiculatus]